MNQLANILGYNRNNAVQDTLRSIAASQYDDKIMPLTEVKNRFKAYYVANNIKPEHYGRYSRLGEDIGVSRERSQKIAQRYNLTPLMDTYNPEKNTSLSELEISGYKNNKLDNILAGYKKSPTFNSEFGEKVRSINYNDNRAIDISDIKGLERKIIDDKICALPFGAKTDYISRAIVDSGLKYQDAAREFTKQYTGLALERTHGNIALAAKYMDISVHRIKEIMKDAGLKPVTFSNKMNNVFMDYIPDYKKNSEEKAAQEKTKAKVIAIQNTRSDEKFSKTPSENKSDMSNPAQVIELKFGSNNIPVPGFDAQIIDIPVNSSGKIWKTQKKAA